MKLHRQSRCPRKAPRGGRLGNAYHTVIASIPTTPLRVAAMVEN
jgi:hypothetical protein